MVNQKNIHNVEIQCKTISKNLCILSELFCVKFKNLQNYVYKIFSSHIFSHFSTYFFTICQPLFLMNIFHYSTIPTYITINNKIERN